MASPNVREPAWWQIALASFLLVAALAQAPFWPLLESRAFDLLATLAPPAPDPRVVVVAIDEPAFAELQRQWPWPRRIHAQLLRGLADAGARAVALDMLLVEPSRFGADDDAALAEAIAAWPGRVVLAGDQTLIETPQLSQLSRIEPLPALLDAGALAGLATVQVDGDNVLRRLPADEDSLARGLIHAAGLPPPAFGAALLHYHRPGAFARASYYQALDPPRFLPPDFFRDKLVLVGLDLHGAADPMGQGADSFATPWTLGSQQRMAGVEVHANVVSNLLGDAGIHAVPRPWGLILLAAVALGSSWLARRWHPWRAVAALGLGSVVVLGGAATVLLLGRAWVPPLQIVFGLGLPWVFQGGVAFVRERARRRYITQAFGRYVSPALVERLQREPGRLSLGGEVRQLTVLFLDIRGFTSLAEAWADDPQGLTQLINRFMTPMSEIVLREDGTIDKYIGDALMAFWNAPLDVADHPWRACRAALAMQAALADFNHMLAVEMQAAGRQPLSLDIGIGINTGPCLVGNLGSELRFDYSALGDAVNLAARLEGMSRRYGCRIVLGPDTADAVSGRLPLLELDLLAVKGKQLPVRVFTLLEEEGEGADEERRLIAAQARLLAAYRAGDWPAARQALTQVEASGRVPGLAAAYADRLARLEGAPPPSGWNGVYVATDK